MGKWIIRVLAGALGICLGIVVFLCFSLVKVEDSSMLPLLRPGQCVLINKIQKDEIGVGDLIYYRTPYYEIDGGRFFIREVIDVEDAYVRVGCEANVIDQKTQIVSKEKIMGKVMGISWEKKNEN